ncbi:hypothetical protein Hypma_016435 [Hypsizygus marmoreus]|uniref:Chitin-binding type-4 domain-containing protein n=1 Tax=Hypsizygus marmoreus TaxID=39966 RepID=A0A369J2I0_HYPMA|nr:hypothetical protein Hypma_016435 [Hypsizygus marmoreus]
MRPCRSLAFFILLAASLVALAQSCDGSIYELGLSFNEDATVQARDILDALYTTVYKRALAMEEYESVVARTLTPPPSPPPGLRPGDVVRTSQAGGVTVNIIKAGGTTQNPIPPGHLRERKKGYSDLRGNDYAFVVPLTGPVERRTIMDILTCPDCVHLSWFGFRNVKDTMDGWAYLVVCDWVTVEESTFLQSPLW